MEKKTTFALEIIEWNKWFQFQETRRRDVARLRLRVCHRLWFEQQDLWREG